MGKSSLIRERHSTLEKMKERTVGEKKKIVYELSHLPTSLAAFSDQFRKEKAYLHIKLKPS